MTNFRKCTFKKLHQQAADLKKAYLKKQQAEQTELAHIQEISASIAGVTREILKNREIATQKTIRTAYIDASIAINEQENFTAEEVFFAAGFISASESMLSLFLFGDPL